MSPDRGGADGVGGDFLLRWLLPPLLRDAFVVTLPRSPRDNFVAVLQVLFWMG